MHLQLHPTVGQSKELLLFHCFFLIWFDLRAHSYPSGYLFQCSHLNKMWDPGWIDLTLMSEQQPHGKPYFSLCNEEGWQHNPCDSEWQDCTTACWDGWKTILFSFKSISAEFYRQRWWQRAFRAIKIHISSTSEEMQIWKFLSCSKYTLNDPN